MSPTPGAKLLLLSLSVLVAVLASEASLRAWLAWRGRDVQDLAQGLRRSAGAGLDEAGGRYSLFGLVEASPYPDVVYQLKPDLDGLFRDRPVRTSSHAFRGPEVPVAKPDGVYRIVALGDSHLFGWGVGQEETYCSRLQELLDSAAPGRFEVLNFGVPGYNTTMEVATFEHRALAFDPDLVVLHFVGNDFELPHFMRPPGERRQGGWVLARLARAAFASGDDNGLLAHGLEELPEGTDAESVEGQYEHMKGWEGHTHALDRLAELTAERGVPVIVMMLGTGDERRQTVVRLAGSRGFDVLNAAPFFRAYLDARGVEPDPSRRHWKAAFIIPNDGHPTPLAHRLYARLLYGELAERGLVPPLPDGGLGPAPEEAGNERLEGE